MTGELQCGVAETLATENLHAARTSPHPTALAEQAYGEDMLNLVLARGYITKLVDNKRVFRYLEQHQAEVLEQFVMIIQTASVEV